MKTCYKCKFYTGTICHGHNEYWGECKKNRNTLICYDDTPCLQDVKTLRILYWQLKQENDKLKWDSITNQTWEERYNIQKRIAEKYKGMYVISLQHTNPKEYKQLTDEVFEFIKKYDTEHIKKITSKQD